MEIFIETVSMFVFMGTFIALGFAFCDFVVRFFFRRIAREQAVLLTRLNGPCMAPIYAWRVQGISKWGFVVREDCVLSSTLENAFDIGMTIHPTGNFKVKKL